MDLLTQREQLMEDIDCIMESNFGEVEYTPEVIAMLCDAVIKNFPTDSWTTTTLTSTCWLTVETDHYVLDVDDFLQFEMIAAMMEVTVDYLLDEFFVDGELNLEDVPWES